jgi:ABC-type uncharacterized transport system substrate-binding protein
VVAVCILTASPAVRAQPTGKVYRIGFLTIGSATASPPFIEALRQGLRELGWVEGQNIVIEPRFAEGKFDRLPALAAELVQLKVDVIATGGTAVAVAVRNVTRTVPIVMMGAAGPVELGLVASLARPGGNVTGVAYDVGLQTIDKALELFREALPKARRVAIVWNPVNPAQALVAKSLKGSAGSLGMQVRSFEASGVGQIDAAFAAMARDRVDAVMIVPDAMFGIHRARLAELATRNRLPSMHGYREFVAAGGLMSYGPNLVATHRRAAFYVDKILRGAKPADLPVEQPTTFELVINLKTAKTLGLRMPQSLLARADHVIE